MPGVDRSVFRTDDPEAAREAFAPLVPRLQFGRVDPEVFRVRLQTSQAPGFSVVDYAFDAPTTVSDAGADDVLVVSPRGRGIELRHGGTPFEAGRPYINASEGVFATWESWAARAVVLDRTRVADVARMVAGRDAGRPEPVKLAARSTDLGRRWDATVAGVVGAMAAAPRAFEEPVVVEAAFHRLAVVYLNAFDLAWEGAAGAGVPVGARTPVVRRALEVMHARAAEAITVQHVAEAVHISARGLHAAFVGETGRPPSAHLRAIRLDGARDELRFAPPGATVAEIAHRWGFVHLPRFAESYARAYGELPSQTRRRRA